MPTENKQTKAAWIVEYSNDTGSNDECFYEWWNVTNGEKTFRAWSKEDADSLAAVLTSQPDLLEALQAMVDFWCSDKPAEMNHTQFKCRADELANLAKTALSKAA